MNDEQIFFDASEYISNLRCTVQKTGKIGFSDYTQTKLGITENMSIGVGIDGPKDSYKNLLLQLIDVVDPTAFKIKQAGKYFYFNPKPLLDQLGIDYKKNNIMYEMVVINEARKIYKLVKKEGKVST